MEQLETKEERYFKKCMKESQYALDGKTYVRVGDAVKQLERMYPKTEFALLRRQSLTDNKWAHLIIPAFYVESYVKSHNYEDEDKWFSIIGSYRAIRKEQNYLMEMNRNA
jgi:ArsR family metal-binding transcriptional regulator|tara:strand:- start:7420 stop:7749 length:330 start_codon:yes stop_codon:yes gene_type:complete